eukprot:gene28355-35194_t
MSITADTYVRARIDSATKERAAIALEAMGLSISDAIRLLMLRVADERRLPFDVKVPNAKTRKAIAELESGKGKKFVNRDYKREAKGRHRATLDEDIRPVLLALLTDQPLEAKYRDHDLSGDWAETLRLARFGSHSELFG